MRATSLFSDAIVLLLRLHSLSLVPVRRERLLVKITPVSAEVEGGIASFTQGVRLAALRHAVDPIVERVSDSTARSLLSLRQLAAREDTSSHVVAILIARPIVL